MNKVATYLITSFVFSMNTGLVFSQMNTPTAAKKEKTLLHHNHQRIDNYYWMNERDSPQVLEYISKENEYARDYFGPLKNLQEKLLEEFESRIDPNESFAPVSINGLTYQIRNKVGEDYGYIYLLNGDKEMIYFNENERAKGNSFYSLGDWNPSPDNNTLAVGEDFTGRRKYQIQFRNNKTGKYLKDKIIDTDGSLVWGNDNKTVFYVRKDPQTLREFQIWRHVLGTSPEKDELVYEEKDEKFYVFVSKSMTKKHILIGSFSSLTSEVQLIDADKPLSSPQVFLKREPGHIYAVDFNDAGFIITSNKKAKNKKILFSKNIPTSIEACTEIQRHDKDVLIENVLVFKNHIVIEERQNGLKKIKVLNFKTMEFEYIAINEETYSIDFAFNDDYEGEKLYYSYNSMTTPSTIFKYDLTFKNQVVYHEKKLIDVNFNPKNYQSERIWAVANDGTKIPVSFTGRGLFLKKHLCFCMVTVPMVTLFRMFFLPQDLVSWIEVLFLQVPI